MMIAGLNTKEIGDRLNISPKTVEYHRSVLYQRFPEAGSNPQGLIIYAMKHLCSWCLEPLPFPRHHSMRNHRKCTRTAAKARWRRKNRASYLRNQRRWYRKQRDACLFSTRRWQNNNAPYNRLRRRARTLASIPDATLTESQHVEIGLCLKRLRSGRGRLFERLETMYRTKL